MKTIIKNGFTVTYPDNIEAGKEYEIIVSADANSNIGNRRATFYITTKSGVKKSFTVEQQGTPSAS